MKLIVNISDEMYNTFQRGAWSVTYSGKKIRDIVMKGTPLPEHKGRLMLIDIDELPFFKCSNNIKKCPSYYDFTCQHCDYGITSRFRVERIGTLIESKEEKENE